MIECVELDDDARRVVIMQAAAEHGCPRCGVVVGGRPYDVRESRVTDLPFGERALVVVWRKRRYRCQVSSCRQKLFVERSDQIRPRRRSSERLRRKLAEADGEARACSRVAAEYRVSWWLGIDETRTRRPRWYQDPDTGRWVRQEPWMTSLTDLDLASARVILGLTPGRSSAAVSTWMGARDQAWRDGVEVVAIDPCAVPAPGHDRRRPLPPRPARQPDADHRAPPGHLGQPRPPGTAGGPGVGQPPPPAHRR